MSKIYVVTAGEYSDYGICAVFSTREQAEKYCACGHGEYVEEYDLDAWSADGCEVAYRYHVQYPRQKAGSIADPRYLLKKDVEKDLQKIVNSGIRSVPDGPKYNRWDHVTAEHEMFHPDRYVYLDHRDPELALKIVRDRIAKAKAEKAGL